MLVHKNLRYKGDSVYSCDRCKAQLNVYTKIAIYVGLPSRQPKKKYDLCKRCYRAFVRGVEKE